MPITLPPLTRRSWIKGSLAAALAPSWARAVEAARAILCGAAQRCHSSGVLVHPHNIVRCQIARLSEGTAIEECISRLSDGVHLTIDRREIEIRRPGRRLSRCKKCGGKQQEAETRACEINLFL